MRCNKIFLLFFVLIVFSLPVFSEPKFFGGIHGDYYSRGDSLSDYDLGSGWGGGLEGGAYFGNLSLGILGGYAYIGEGTLVQKLNEFKLGVEAGLDFDKEIIPFLPNWLALRPNVAAFVDFYKSDGYRSESKKSFNYKENSSGVSGLFETGIALDFVNLLRFKSYNLIPNIAYYEVFRPERDGLIYSGKISLGLRILYAPERKQQIDQYTIGVIGESGGTLSVFAKTNTDHFSPDGEGSEDKIIFDVTSDAAEHGGVALWELRIYDPGRKVFFAEKGKGELPKDYTWKGTGSKGEIVEGGCDYQYVWYVKANDGADGYMPGIISTDVMLKEEDGVLSFSLSSIQFGPNSAKFDNLKEEEIKHNKDLFDTIAQILNKYAEYTVTIEGHANNVSGTQEEHIKELLPLSQARAETVKAELVQRGIDANRLIPVGRGSEKMISTNKDEAWKNRRVEFYMEKKE